MNYFEGKYAEFMLHEHLGLHEPAYHVSIIVLTIGMVNPIWK